MVEKNKEYILDIISQGYEGEGIAKIEGYPIFIEGALQGEKVKVKIVKVKKSYAYGKLLEKKEKYLFISINLLFNISIFWISEFRR